MLRKKTVFEKPLLNPHVVCLQKGKAWVEGGGTHSNLAWASTVQANLMRNGFMLSKDVMDNLQKLPAGDILSFHDSLVPYITTMTGGGKNFKPLYFKFPNDVMTDDDVKIMQLQLAYHNATGEWSDELDMPTVKVFENVKYTVLKLTDYAGYLKIFTDLVSINTSLMPQDLDVVKYFITAKEPVVMPDVIPFKENLCTLAGMGVPGLPVKTTTDVLRIAVHLSGGDISLPKVPAAKKKMNRWSTALSDNPDRAVFKFKKFSRSERKYILELLENSNCDVKEMKLKRERWLRLAHVLHPGDYRLKYPTAYQAIDDLRNTKVTSWYGDLAASFKSSLTDGLKMLAKRSGEFVRRLDWLLRNNKKDSDQILTEFWKTGGKASNKTLFELYQHVNRRAETMSERSVFVKGARKKTELPVLEPLPKKVVEDTKSFIKAILMDKFALLDKLGKVYIDPLLKKIPLPTNLRSMDYSLKPVLRGQRVPLDNPDAKVVRAFIHWFDKNGDYDPDLSATFVGMGKSQVLSYSGLNVGKSVHSGDVIGRKGSNAEYIDIVISDAKKMGFKYVVLDVRNFRGGSLEQIGLMGGFMEREHPTKSTTWDASTVNGCRALTSSASTTLIGIVDIETMEYIHLDIDSTGVTYTRGDVSTVLKTINQFAKEPEFSVYDLLELHAEARGTMAITPEEADTVFRSEDFLNSYEKTGEYMGV